jgi:hypothetical protein
MRGLNKGRSTEAQQIIVAHDAVMRRPSFRDQPRKISWNLPRDGPAPPSRKPSCLGPLTDYWSLEAIKPAAVMFRVH